MIIIILLLLFLTTSSSAPPTNVTAHVNTSSFQNVVSPMFHGVAMDSSLFTVNGIRKDVDLSSPKLRNILSSISPCYLRVGGTAANWAFFDLPPSILAPLKLPRATILTKKLFDDLVNLTLTSGNRLLYDLNAEMRYGDTWNPTDAIRLFEYCQEMGYGSNIDWELGNEPNHISPSNLSTSNVASDTIILHQLIQQYPIFQNSSIVGPDVGWMGVEYISKVADVAGQFLTAYSIHQYYFNGTAATLDNYTDPANFINLDKLFNRVRSALENVSNSDKPWWMGETSSGYSGGTKGVSDTFVSGFLYLEKLGFSAANNVDVVIRQTIFNGNYALLDLPSFEPFPDMWLLWTHHNLVGRGVLNVTLTSAPKLGLRLYAQCTKEGTKYPAGSVTMFALNVNKEHHFKISFSWDSFQGVVEEFVLSAFDKALLSRKVMLNGKLLAMKGDDMPEFPRKGKAVNSIVVQPLTMAFYVFKEAALSVCMPLDMPH